MVLSDPLVDSLEMVSTPPVIILLGIIPMSLSISSVDSLESITFIQVKILQEMNPMDLISSLYESFEMVTLQPDKKTLLGMKPMCLSVP